MVTQSYPDAVYGIIIVCGLLAGSLSYRGVFTARMVRETLPVSRLQITQRMRYTMWGFGVATSVVAAVLPLALYGPSTVYTALSELRAVSPTFGWAVTLLYAFALTFFVPAFTSWKEIYYRPSTLAYAVRNSHGQKHYRRMADVQMGRGGLYKVTRGGYLDDESGAPWITKTYEPLVGRGGKHIVGQRMR